MAHGESDSPAARLHGGPEAELRARIRARGPITFAEFHQVALYWLAGGYYVAQNPLGPQGDFYTAPLTHPVFGALIARQLLQLWQLMGSPTPFWVVEPGAGSGRLATDVASHLTVLEPGCSGALRYVAVDLRPPHQPPGGAVAWLRSVALPLQGFTGCLVANELLDAMPVHRVVMRGGHLRELLVTVDERGAFAEVEAEPSTPDLARRFRDLGVELPEGYRTEVNLGLEPWLRDVYQAMERGYLLLIDYGHEATVLYDASRSRGTLRCYHRHTLNANPYQHVGGQDISVHVDFTSVRRSAEEMGFSVLGFTTQARFLTNLGLDVYREKIAQRKELALVERRANLEALTMLADPEGMGGFKVLALGKGIPEAGLEGFTPSAAGLGPALVPLATAAHMPWVRDQTEGGETLPSWEELLR